MNLYNRDYTKPQNENEKKARELFDIWEIETKGKIRNVHDDPRFSHPDLLIREFLWHNTSLFPNNHLIMLPYKNIDFSAEADMFYNVVHNSKNEQEIQRYIKSNKKWFIPGSIFLDYNFGHHDAYLFPEESLGGKYTPDYLLIGRNSDGYNLVLIEFEKAETDFLIKTENSETVSVRKGLTQIRDWRTWMDDHRVSFLKDIGLQGHGIDVPTTRIYYYLVVSTRDHMTEDAKIVRSQMMASDSKLKIVTYDRLVDNIGKLAGRNTW